MTPESLFRLGNAAALGGWLLLILLPRWKGSARLVCAVVLPALFGAAYMYLAARYFGSADGGGFGSVAEVRALFEVDGALVAGWLHYLAFDLFVGAWEVRDAQALGIHHLAVVPCLLLTFMLGPIGLLCYLAIRAGWKKRLVIDEPVGADALATA